MKKNRFFLIIPFAFLALADGAVTLYYQPAEYWSDHSIFNEGMPVFKELIQIGPLAFSMGIVVWFASWSSVIYFVPPALSVGCAIAGIYGHSLQVHKSSYS